MATAPAYATTPRIGSTQPIVANTNTDGSTGTYYQVITGVSTGTRIDRVSVALKGIIGTASNANVLRFWINNGSTRFLYHSLAIATATPSAAGASAGTILPATFSTPNLVLPNSSYSLDVSAHAYADGRDGYAVNALGADL